MAPLVPKEVLSTPKYSFDPVRSNNAEFGTNGRGTGIPAVNAFVDPERVMATICVMHVEVVLLQPVVVA
jgi:hypothetical protein